MYVEKQSRTLPPSIYGLFNDGLTEPRKLCGGERKRGCGFEEAILMDYWDWGLGRQPFA
jgi:hypothetical protein